MSKREPWADLRPPVGGPGHISFGVTARFRPVPHPIRQEVGSSATYLALSKKTARITEQSQAIVWGRMLRRAVEIAVRSDGLLRLAGTGDGPHHITG